MFAFDLSTLAFCSSFTFPFDTSRIVLKLSLHHRVEQNYLSVLLPFPCPFCFPFFFFLLSTSIKISISITFQLPFEMLRANVAGVIFISLSLSVLSANMTYVKSWLRKPRNDTSNWGHTLIYIYKRISIGLWHLFFALFQLT